MKKSHIIFLIFLATLFISCSTENEYEYVKEDDFINTDKDSLVIAHWNIGHFSNGKSFNTAITSENYSEKQIQYIYTLDTIKADIIGICEYNPEFDNNGNLAQDAIFYKYNNFIIGPKHQFNCNAIFSKDIPLYNGSDINFSSTVQHRYMQCSDIKVNDVIIKIIETHLDWNQGDSGKVYRTKQIKEIIESTKKNEHVIICGDFNISDISEYDAFKNAGYCLANDGDRNISSLKNPLDNIIVKGLQISNMAIIKCNNLSDHNVIKCCLLF